MKFRYMLLALMPLCMASCSEEENIVSGEVQQKVRIIAGTDTGSRLALSDQGDQIRSLWQDGDQITLFTSTQSNLVYRTSLNKNMATAEFTPVDEALEFVEGNTVYGCYPDVTLASEGGTVVGLPATGSFDYNNGTLRSFGYAVGTIEDEGVVNLKFKHISAYLGLLVTPDMLSDATKGISTVTVSTSSSDPLSVGEGDTFDFSTQTATTTNGSNTVTVNVDNQVVESYWSIYVPVLPQPAEANITITLADSEGQTLYTITKPTPETGFQAGYVYKTGGTFDVAYLIDGPTFNGRIRELADGDTYGHASNVKNVEFLTDVQTLPEEYIAVSAEDSPAPVYASFNRINGLLTIFTPAASMEVVDASQMFYELGNVRNIDLGNFQINETTTNLSRMFYACHSLTALDVSNWNTDNVTYMGYVFYGCSSLTSLDVSNWNTDNVTDMDGIFRGCSSLTSLDVANWNTENVTEMHGIFIECSSLTSLDVANWNTENVTYMGDIFGECSSLTSLDVTNWNTNNVTDMGGIFRGCSSLTSLDVSNWNTENVTYMELIFYGCSSLTSLDVSNWNTNNVTYMELIFMVVIP